MTATTELIARLRQDAHVPGVAPATALQAADALESAVQQPNRADLRRAIERTEVWRVFGFNIDPILDAILAALPIPATGEVLAMLDDLNASGGIAYDDYSRLHDAVARLSPEVTP